jgi:hypothetical protein
MLRTLPIVLCLLLAAPAARACGEGRFNNGSGLAYQTYLAPRPATVLILDAAPGEERQALYAGLIRAGHRVTVVRDDAALGDALAAGGVDVVIGGLEVVQSLPASSAHPLPIVTRDQRDAARSRFGAVLVDGAGLTQYLKGIHRALAAAR